MVLPSHGSSSIKEGVRSQVAYKSISENYTTAMHYGDGGTLITSIIADCGGSGTSSLLSYKYNTEW